MRRKQIKSISSCPNLQSRPGNCQSCQQLPPCLLILHHLQVSAKDIKMNVRFEMSHPNTSQRSSLILFIAHFLSHISLTSKEASLSPHPSFSSSRFVKQRFGEGIFILCPESCMRKDEWKQNEIKSTIEYWILQWILAQNTPKESISKIKGNSEIHHSLCPFPATHFLIPMFSVTHCLISISLSIFFDGFIHSSMTYPLHVAEAFQHILCAPKKQQDAKVSVKTI